MQKKRLILPLLFLTIFGLQSCETTDVEVANGDWFKLSDLDGLARYSAVGFSIGDYGYLGAGADEDNYKLNDFWKFDPSKNTWTQIADFPGAARIAAVGFGLEGKGYIGTGLDIEDNKLKDFWAYDPESNTWEQKMDFPGSARRSAVSFTLDNKAYVGTGNNNGVSLTDLWQYDPLTETWTEKLDFDDTTVERSYGYGFSLNNKGYFAGSSSSSTVWEYSTGGDDDLGVWAEVTSFEGSGRNYPVAWSINNEGYVATGSNGLSRYDDLWKFTPDIVQDDE